MNFKGIEIEGGPRLNIFIEELILMGVEPEIIGMVEAKEWVDGDIFSKFVDDAYNMVNEYDSGAIKKIVNSWTGTFNCKWNVQNRGFITTSPDVMECAFDSGMDIEWCEDDNGIMNICWDASKTRKDGDLCLNYIGVVGSGIINLMKMRNFIGQYIEQFPNPRKHNLEIFGWNTDAIYFKCRGIEKLRADKTCLETMIEQPYTLNPDEFKNGYVNRKLQ